MVDRDVFDLRLSKLEELLTRLRELMAIDRKTFLADPGVQAKAERWTQLAAEVCLDLAQHLIASQGWRTPTTSREAFRILRDEGVLTPDHAGEMEGWAGLRNILVHIYLDIDHDMLYAILTGELDQLEAYAAILARTVQRL